MDQEEIYLILYSLESSGMRPALVGIVLKALSLLDVLLVGSIPALKDGAFSESGIVEADYSHTINFYNRKSMQVMCVRVFILSKRQV